jgi:hypothetical protein
MNTTYISHPTVCSQMKSSKKEKIVLKISKLVFFINLFAICKHSQLPNQILNILLLTNIMFLMTIKNHPILSVLVRLTTAISSVFENWQRYFATQGAPPVSTLDCLQLQKLNKYLVGLLGY